MSDGALAPPVRGRRIAAINVERGLLLALNKVGDLSRIRITDHRTILLMPSRLITHNRIFGEQKGIQLFRTATMKWTSLSKAALNL